MDTIFLHRHSSYCFGVGNLFHLEKMTRIILFIISVILLLASSARANELERILDQANKYTVKIYNSTDTPFIEDSYNPSAGSGFLIDKANGIIITNAHVASYSPALNRVNFKYSNPMQSKQAYIDTELDLALLKIDPKLIPSNAVEAKLHCKNDYKQGQSVVAFGHPAGKDFTITRGIISAVRFESDFFESIQTDAAINRGNSGGALIDENTGLVIGINSFGSIENQGLNFALPSYTVCKVIDLFKNKKDPSPLNFNVLFSNNREQGKFLKVSEVLTANNLLRVPLFQIQAVGTKAIILRYSSPKKRRQNMCINLNWSQV